LRGQPGGAFENEMRGANRIRTATDGSVWRIRESLPWSGKLALQTMCEDHRAREHSPGDVHASGVEERSLRLTQQSQL
jgi:hypothetical protein